VGARARPGRVTARTTPADHCRTPASALAGNVVCGSKGL
jgi:hypothetical protein